MTQVQYVLRPLDSDRTLMTFEEQERQKALDWAKSRNSNRIQTPVRVIEVITEVTERELAA